MNHDEHLDNLLDQVLSEYRDAEPLSGLEDRVLRRLVQAGDVRKIPWLRWAIAAACTVLVAFAIWFSIARRTIETHAPDTLANAKPAQQAPAQVPTPLVGAPAVTAHRVSKAIQALMPPVPAATEAQAKPPVFPQPTPLTGAEREFMVALQQGPKATPGASEESSPITIAEIEIKPLFIGGISSGEKQ